HGRQRRIEQAEPGIIIQGDEAEILRTPHTHLLGCLHKTYGHQKIRHKHSIRAVRQQRQTSAVAGVDTVITLIYQLWVEVQAAGFERLLEPLKPGSSVAYAERTAHHGDGFMPDSG